MLFLTFALINLDQPLEHHSLYCLKFENNNIFKEISYQVYIY